MDIGKLRLVVGSQRGILSTFEVEIIEIDFASPMGSRGYRYDPGVEGGACR